MKHPTLSVKSRRARLAFLLGAVTAVVGMVVAMNVSNSSGSYTLTRRVVDVPYEKALGQYVDLLKSVDGVIAAEYRDYDPLRKTAMVTVTYDPHVTTPKVLLIYFGNMRSIWEKPVIA